MTKKVNKSFWKNKKVFVTGHTGFKGSWICTWLNFMGSIVRGYSLTPKTSPNLFTVLNLEDKIESEFADIRDYKALENSIISFKPDILVHMAAQPFVRYSYNNPIETYTTNVLGTQNILEVIRKCNSIKSTIIVTTDKCYSNEELDIPFKEDDKLGGFDPYSSSKACCEILTNSYIKSFFNDDKNSFIATVRAGNVIGGGDWSEDRLIPDIFRSLDKNLDLKIRNPKAIRPWQHVLEPLSGYLILAEKLFENGKKYQGAWNFGPNLDDCKTVEWIVNNILKKSNTDLNWKLDSIESPYESKFLKLDISKAINLLGWNPRWDLDKTLYSIIQWHEKLTLGYDMNKVCINEIKKFNYEK